jgi:hypothetical protein
MTTDTALHALPRTLRNPLRAALKAVASPAADGLGDRRVMASIARRFGCAPITQSFADRAAGVAARAGPRAIEQLAFVFFDCGVGVSRSSLRHDSAVLA